MVTQSDVRGWAGGLEAVLDRIRSRFRRAGPRRRAAACLRGLLALVERRNGWRLAEAVGDVAPDGVQDLLSRAQWDADAVRDDLQAQAPGQLGDAGAVLDETGLLRKGTKSAGAQRHGTGAAGRIGNAQAGVFLGCAGQHGHALIERALRLPREWTEDADRRREAHVREAVAFTTRPKLGLALPEQARGAAMKLPKRERQRLSAGEGAKGPRLHDCACPATGRRPACDARCWSAARSPSRPS